MHLQKRRNDGLDLLRAAAITFVLMDHFGAMVFQPPLAGQLVFTFAGVTGVDIFFALSGFLIGRILLSINRQGWSWSAIGLFWTRRWLRTLPLYFVVLTFASWLLDLWNWETFFFLQNFDFDRPQPLTVSWSLVLEEFCYFFYPLLIAFSVAVAPHWLRGGRSVLAVAVGLILACNLARWAVANWDLPVTWPSMNPLLRLDCCAYGLTAAWVSVGKPRIWGWIERNAGLLSLVSIGVIGMMGTLHTRLIIPHFPSPWMTNGFLRLRLADGDSIVIAGAALLVSAVATRLTVVPRGLANLFRGVSEISYALYLVHTLVMFVVVGRLMPQIGPLASLMLMLGGSLLPAWGLRIVIERPFLRLRDSFWRDTPQHRVSEEAVA